MSNPFPGVNPHIEATADLWVGFHNVLIGDMSKLLNVDLVSRGYVAIVDKRIELVDTRELGDVRIPDVSLVRPSESLDRRASTAAGAMAVLDLEPADLENPTYENVSVAYIEIRRLPGKELVTGIELLSPANKGSDRGDYQSKRAELLHGRVNLIEIDLLLGGQPPDVLGHLPPGHFHAYITRAARPRLCKAYGWSIRDALPRLPVPLALGDDEAVLDLAAAYRMTYDGGAFDAIIPYDRPLPGPLSDADRVWVAERVATVHR